VYSNVIAVTAPLRDSSAKGRSQWRISTPLVCASSCS